MVERMEIFVTSTCGWTIFYGLIYWIQDHVSDVCGMYTSDGVFVYIPCVQSDVNLWKRAQYTLYLYMSRNVWCTNCDARYVWSIGRVPMVYLRHCVIKFWQSCVLNLRLLCCFCHGLGWHQTAQGSPHPVSQVPTLCCVRGLGSAGREGAVSQGHRGTAGKVCTLKLSCKQKYFLWIFQVLFLLPSSILFVV